MKTKGLSFEDHTATGLVLSEMNEKLCKLVVKVGEHYPRNSKVGRRVHAAKRALNALRCELDNQLFADCPAETAGDGWKRVYYGGIRPVGG